MLASSKLTQRRWAIGGCWVVFSAAQAVKLNVSQAETVSFCGVHVPRSFCVAPLISGQVQVLLVINLILKGS